MSRMAATGLGCLGMLLGLGVGGVVAYYSMYGVAQLISSSTETQAYLTLLIIPAIALIGAVGPGFLLAGWRTSNKFLSVLGIASIAVLLLIAALGLEFHHVWKPIEIRVSNQSHELLTDVRIGSDFRRGPIRVRSLAPGEVSDSHRVDASRRGTTGFVGRLGSQTVSHYPDLSGVKRNEAFTYVVTETERGAVVRLVDD